MSNRAPLRRLFVVSLATAAVALTSLRPLPAFADEATDRARARYETGLQLFYAREHAQALVEFQRAHEIKPRPATLFMMAQCEYMLGSLKDARQHYDAYLRESPDGEFVEVAKDRIESINRRPATLVINSVPDLADVRITAAPALTTTAPATAAPAPAAPATATGTATAAPPASPPVEDLAGEPAVPGETIASGQAPNNFTVPRGRWVISVSKPNYVSQSATVDVDVADSRSLFFKLEPIPARLEVVTAPAGATLYVNGNRARNPYRQNVPPGRYELFAEATDYKDRTEEFVLAPGQRKLLVGPDAFRLRYVQRSGRPELFAASAIMGAIVGAGAVAAGLDRVGQSLDDNPKLSSVTFFVGGAMVGTAAGTVMASTLVPDYIPDNRALFILGAMWVGAADGALTRMVIGQATTDASYDVNTTGAPVSTELGPFLHRPKLGANLRAAFLGGLPGLAVGVTAGALFAKRAPTYGRVALIQSAALGGALVGGLTALALRWRPIDWRERDTTTSPATLRPGYSLFDLSVPALIGLNVGVGAGLLGAYLPDQTRYGPTWQRIGLVDLAAVAGALAGGIAGCVADKDCVTTSTDEGKSEAARARAAGLALLGGALGLGAGVLLTRNFDDAPSSSSEGAGSSAPPAASVSLLPVPGVAPDGTPVPMLAALGYF